MICGQCILCLCKVNIVTKSWLYASVEMFLLGPNKTFWYLFTVLDTAAGTAAVCVQSEATGRSNSVGNE